MQINYFNCKLCSIAYQKKKLKQKIKIKFLFKIDILKQKKRFHMIVVFPVIVIQLIKVS
jgi:hypothetical protein